MLPKALTRFTLQWRWDGKPALLQSRAVDETGFVQPTIARAARSARHQLDLQQQLDPDLAGEAGRERVRCPACLAARASPPRSSGAASAAAMRRRAAPGHYGYGTPATPEQIAGWAIDVRPDGAGPAARQRLGRTRAPTSTPSNARACHGTFGEGEGRYPKLAGGEGTLTSERPEPTRRQLLAVRHHAVRLHQPGDAVPGAARVIGRRRLRASPPTC